MTQTVDRPAVLHLRLNGRSLDVPLDQLGLTPEPDDAAVKRAVARFAEVPAEWLTDYAIDRHATGNLTVRPPAVFG